ncbi:uncharacterized protein HME9302_00326 [Alteripontixanthobacter maritimus]|uniref:Sigma-54 factor interaction domain-containing protein n=1 Tax=Alteripontixanthobacter maritimus TaxID=2161824 RepID=A0A369Q2L4_9SPHN|nr:sigma 54-interacting transcriptional regulator [Alteripontixanthobacter maritimus]RDC59141.1 uncharacterized protein HME9302_00326 [Alteripontixanthobacter maritimus]
MQDITASETAKNNHGGLCAAGVAQLESRPGDGSCRLYDTAERPASLPGGQVVTLARGEQSRLTRLAPAKFALAYDDAAGTGPLAALHAAATAPGQPVCADPASLAMMAVAGRVAASDIPVLVEGPTGTGKEVLARFIHEHSARKSGPFVAINCAAMPETMLEALLFGHKKGAYTGATEAAEGFVRAADGGTLLLDEIGEMPIALQAKLLRTLQEGEVVPLGATKPVPVDIRVIACTNRDLPTEVAEGRFRADLYYRLNVFPLQIEALRSRKGDIAPLAFAMILRHCPAEGAVPFLTEAALAKLAAHAWPGNVRELENVVRRALLLAGDTLSIDAEHIRFDTAVRRLGTIEHAAPPVLADGNQLSDIARHSETRAILDTLELTGGRRGAAARKLGISERTLRYRMAAMREAGTLDNAAAQQPRVSAGAVR